MTKRVKRARDLKPMLNFGFTPRFCLRIWILFLLSLKGISTLIIVFFVYSNTLLERFEWYWDLDIFKSIFYAAAGISILACIIGCCGIFDDDFKLMVFYVFLETSAVIFYLASRFWYFVLLSIILIVLACIYLFILKRAKEYKYKTFCELL